VYDDIADFVRGLLSHRDEVGPKMLAPVQRSPASHRTIYEAMKIRQESISIVGAQRCDIDLNHLNLSAYRP
jgi:hypothetical protein